MNDIRDAKTASTALAKPGNLETRIHDSRRLDVSDQIEVGSGGIQYRSMSEMMEGAKLMAISKQAVPKHLRNEPGMCLAVLTDSVNWGIQPYALARMSYAVNDILAYEAKASTAVILRNGPLKERALDEEFFGEGEAMYCRISATLKSGKVVSYESPPIRQIHPKNSPLWKSDPRQQMFYYSSRALARRHFPHVLAGAIFVDEVLEQGPDNARNVTPQRSLKETFAAPTGRIGGFDGGAPAVDADKPATDAPVIDHDAETGEVIDDAAGDDPIDEIDSAFARQGDQAAAEGTAGEDDAAGDEWPIAYPATVDGWTSDLIRQVCMAAPGPADLRMWWKGGQRVRSAHGLDVAEAKKLERELVAFATQQENSNGE